MVNISIVNFKDILRFNQEAIYDFEESILVADVGIRDLHITRMFPIRTSFFMFVLVEQGTMRIELDYSIHHLSKQDFLLILPEHIYQSISGSPDTRYRLIFVEQAYFETMNRSKNDVLKTSFLNIRKDPVIHLSEEEFKVLASCHERLEQRMPAIHHFKKDIINALLLEYVIEAENMMINHHEHQVKQSNLTRQDIIFHNFLTLLKKDVIYQHHVSFYADKLHITPQYLASVLKQLTGKGTKDWIADALLVEAKIMLQHSQQSVQQISDALNFYDQSTFGKFFKARTGQTPKAYQNL